MNKRIITVIVAVLATGFAAIAQPGGGFGGGMPRMGGFGMGFGNEEVPTPKERATQEADRLRDSLALDAKQYKKVFAMFRSEFTAEENQNNNFGGFGGGMPMGGGMMPPMGGGDFGEFGGFGGGMSQRGDMSGMMKNAMERAMESRREREDKKFADRSKKMVKILTAEQFRKWEDINKADRLRREEEMRQAAESARQRMQEFRQRNATGE